MITGKELGALLSHIHQHDKKGKIIYYEDDLLKVLKAIGLPKPEWETSISVGEYINKTLIF